ncbi:hypothetical protein [Nocardiopsis sp. L17-MgMaSL7]|uniref:hypothetical protein n=1 Tax=Nocardiopsis sp. L17-MgMaSL7 TaxID=1938893 RepID=UPI000D710310|nr:hypothetical protein [Nocardiopsis sp. L17-MgMaSL7]PWV48525.1 ABC-2 type transport system permease protein [Nocardiopsis sp. L17-MgMaSL7]
MTTTGSDRTSPPAIRDDPSIATVVAVELDKLRRGFCFWLSLVLPFVLVLPLGVVATLSPEGRSGDVWGIWFSVTLLFWGMFLPMAAALYSAMSVRADLASRRVVYAYAFPRHRVLLGRFLALLLLWLGSALLLALLLTVVGAVLVGPQAALPVPMGVLVPWVGAAATLALCLVVAERWGTGLTAVIGVLGMLLSGVIADTSAWWFVPMVWPLRAVVPLAGIEASGVPLEPGDPLFSLALLPVIAALSLALSIVLLAAGARHVNRKEL